jgi:hypothetical protein
MNVCRSRKALFLISLTMSFSTSNKEVSLHANLETKFSRQDISYDEFFDILDPFFKSAFESLGESLDESDFRRFTRSLPPNPHPVILKNLVNSFSDELLATCCVELTKMLQKIMGENKYPLYKTMLTRLSAVRFPQSRELIMLTWTDLMEINDIKVTKSHYADIPRVISPIC